MGIWQFENESKDLEINYRKLDKMWIEENNIPRRATKTEVREFIEIYIITKKFHNIYFYQNNRAKIVFELDKKYVIDAEVYGKYYNEKIYIKREFRALLLALQFLKNSFVFKFRFLNNAVLRHEREYILKEIRDMRFTKYRDTVKEQTWYTGALKSSRKALEDYLLTKY